MLFNFLQPALHHAIGGVRGVRDELLAGLVSASQAHMLAGRDREGGFACPLSRLCAAPFVRPRNGRLPGFDDLGLLGNVAQPVDGGEAFS
jgi:hypothetical protein